MLITILMLIPDFRFFRSLFDLVWIPQPISLDCIWQRQVLLNLHFMFAAALTCR